MHQSIASVASALAAVAKSLSKSSPSSSLTPPATPSSASAVVAALPLELVDPLLSLTIRLTSTGISSRTSRQTKQVLDVISQSSSASSLTLQAALLHGLPWFTVGHATGTRPGRAIDGIDGRDSSSHVRVSLLHALARPHTRHATRKRLVPMSLRPSDLILRSPACSLADQLQVCDWWIHHLPLPTINHLAPLIRDSPHAIELTRYLLDAHAELGTKYSDADMDATLTLLASLADTDLTSWYRHTYSGPLKSLASATSVLCFPDAEAMTLAHDLATPPRVSRHAITRACALGHVEALRYYASLGCTLEPSSRAMDVASKAGHVEVLAWWVQAGMHVKYSEEAVDLASREGHIGVLEWWWKRRGEWPFECTEASVDGASAEGRVDVLRWWADKQPRYSEAAMHAAALNGHVHVLAWWAAESGLHVKLDPRRLAGELSGKLDESGVRVLEWWTKQSAKLPSLVDAVDVRILESCATREAIDFWVSTVGIGASKWVRQWTWPKLTFTVPATNDARVRDWWAGESGLSFSPSSDLMTHLCVRGDIEALEWWATHAAGRPLPALRGQDAFKVMHAGRVDMLAWYAAHDSEVVVQEYAVLLEAVKSLDPRVVEWVVRRYYGGKARMSTQWDGMVEAVDAYGMVGEKEEMRGRGGVKGFVGMGGIRLVG